VNTIKQQIDLINTKENRQLLYKYLSKFYGSDKAKELMKKYNDNLFGKNGLAYSLGKRSIEYFCQHFLQDTFVPKPDNKARKLAPIHYSIWNNLEDMFLKDSFDKLELIMPRGAAKTTVCDFALSVWAHCYKYSIYTLVAGKTEQDSIEFIRETRRAFEENVYIKFTFGELIDTRNYTVNKLELELSNSTKIQAISSSSSMRGKKFNGNRPSLIIADDYQSKTDVITQDARDKKYDTWQQDSIYAGDKAVYRDGKKVKMASKFIVLGTILHRDCFISRLLKDHSYKHIMEKAILVEDVDQLFNSGLWEEFKKIYFNSKDELAQEHGREFYFNHEDEMKYPVLWEDKYDPLDLALDYYSDPQAFKQEMQNDASKIGEKAFHQISSIPREEIEKESFVSTILCCDPAVETKANNDYTALLVGAKTTNNFRWVRKGIIRRFNFDEYINKVIELLKEYEEIGTIWIEKNTFNGADAREIQNRIGKDPNLKSRRINIVNERQNKNKEAKIRAISGKVDSGFIVFAEEDKEFTDQILAYEGEKFSLHDDAPDITAEFDRLIDEINIPKEIKTIPKGWLF
jgi:predicted phage terminase large subunit-like protein